MPLPSKRLGGESTAFAGEARASPLTLRFIIVLGALIVGMNSYVFVKLQLITERFEQYRSEQGKLAEELRTEFEKLELRIALERSAQTRAAGEKK